MGERKREREEGNGRERETTKEYPGHAHGIEEIRYHERTKKKPSTPRKKENLSK